MFLYPHLDKEGTAMRDALSASKPQRRWLRYGVAILLAIAGISIPAVLPAYAQVSCVPDFSYRREATIVEKINCGADTRVVMSVFNGRSLLSPDGNFVLEFETWYGGKDHAKVVAVDGSSTVDLGIASTAGWSPDGTQVALSVPGSQTGTNVNDLDVVNRDGSGRQTLLAEDVNADLYPSWSPDGSKIATVHIDIETARYSINVQDADGSNSRMLYEAGENAQINKPSAWTPDSKYLVFGEFPYNEDPAIYVVGLTGSGAAKLPTLGPAWEPTVARDWSLGYVGIPGVSGPHFIVQNILDTAGAVEFPYEESTGAFEFRPRGTVTAPPTGWPPAGVGGTTPPSTGMKVTSVSSTITSSTPRWNLDLSVGLQNVTCPAKVKITLGTWAKTATACETGQTAPNTLHYFWKVFDTSHSLPPKGTVPVTAVVVGAKAGHFTGSLTLPDAPLLGGVGDSYSSGHHQDEDKTSCIPNPVPVVGSCTPVSLLPNDADFSWVARLGAKLNKNVPAEWRYRVLLEARSGATSSEIFQQGQVDRVSSAVAARGSTWSIITFTAGANNLDFGGVLAAFYGKFFPAELVKPWNVKNWKDCPDTQLLYNRYLNTSDGIRTDLGQILARGRAASTSVRFLDMLYPYVLKTDNVCQADRQIPDPGDLTHSLTWHGAGSVIDGLDSLHLELTGTDVYRVDLRQKFRSNPLPKTQQTRYYGYPHPNDAGQTSAANAAFAILP
jgi:hypothetical protein